MDKFALHIASNKAFEDDLNSKLEVMISLTKIKLKEEFVLSWDLTTEIIPSLVEMSEFKIFKAELWKTVHQSMSKLSDFESFEADYLQKFRDL